MSCSLREDISRLSKSTLLLSPYYTLFVHAMDGTGIIWTGLALFAHAMDGTGGTGIFQNSDFLAKAAWSILSFVSKVRLSHTLPVTQFDQFFAENHRPEGARRRRFLSSVEDERRIWLSHKGRTPGY